MLADGLDAGDIETLYILGAVFMPSIVALLLCLFSAWLPDDGSVVSQQCDDLQHEHHRGNDRGRAWDRAA
jgi:hypothetical protein